MRTERLIPLLFSLLLPACERESEDPAPREASRAAARDACVAEDLVIEAREKLAALQPPDGEGGEVPGVPGAARAYARVYREYAEVQTARLALADSTARARSPADSAHYARKAAAYSLSPPEPGTVEANVAQAYARDFNAIRANPAHFCNQEPLEGGDGR